MPDSLSPSTDKSEYKRVFGQNKAFLHECGFTLNSVRKDPDAGPAEVLRKEAGANTSGPFLQGHESAGLFL